MSSPIIPALPSTVPWITEEIQKGREARALPYKDVQGGLDEIVERKLFDVRPTGVRVMMRAVLAEDAYGKFVHTAYDARQAICFEVIAVSAGAERFWDAQGVPDDARDTRSLVKRLRAFFSGRGTAPFSRPRPGDHVWCASADADRLSGSDPACRLWTVHPEDLPAFWRV